MLAEALSFFAIMFYRLGYCSEYQQRSWMSGDYTFYPSWKEPSFCKIPKAIDIYGWSFQYFHLNHRHYSVCKISFWLPQHEPSCHCTLVNQIQVLLLLPHATFCPVFAGIKIAFIKLELSKALHQFYWYHFF